jgi:hypothetical protein
MPDLDKTIREYVKKKPPGKLHRLKCHNFRFSVILIILPGKTDGLTVKRLDSRIADSHPVSIAAKITNHMSRSLKWFFSENNPVIAV